MNNHSVQNKQEEPLLSVGLRRLLTFFPSAWLCVTAFAPVAKLCSSSFRVFVSKLSFIFSNPSTLQTSPTSVSLLIPLQTVLPASLLHSSTFMFCNPSTLQPRSHCSSPWKLSWSEPQRPLLSIDLRLLTFFHLPDSVLRLLHRLPSFAVLRFVSPVLVWTPTASALRWPSAPYFFSPSAWLCVQHTFRLSCVSFLQVPHFATLPPFSFMPPLFHAFPSFSCVFFLPFSFHF